MIAEQIENKLDDFEYIPDNITRAIIDTMNKYWTLYYNSIITEGEYAYEGKIALVSQMVFATVMEEEMGIAIDKIGEANKYLGFDLSVYISMLEESIGVEYNKAKGWIENTGDGFLGMQQIQIDYGYNTTYAIGKALWGEAVFKEDMKTYEILAIGTKTLQELEQMIIDIELPESQLTEDQIEQLLILAGYADGIIDAIEGGIELVMAQVEELIEPLIDKVVTEKMTEYDDRLTLLELSVFQMEDLFWKWIFESIAKLFAPEQAIIDAAESIIEYLENYIDSELIEVWEQLIYLLERIQAIDAVTITQVQAMIDKSISEIEFPENGNGLPGPPGPMGPMGPMGPVGATGPQGEMGEAGEGQFELENEIANIDSALHDRMDLTGIEYTDYVTEIIEWTIEEIVDINTKIGEEVQPIIDVMTTEMLESITGLVDAFDTPEAIISFLLDVPVGEEIQTYELMQILIANTFELGVEESE